MCLSNWLEDGTLDLETKAFLANTSMEILGGIVIIDENGRIVYMNDKYADSMQIDKSTALGRNIGEIIENTEMLSVLNSGRTDIGVLYSRNDNNFIVNRFPIIKDNKIVGEIGHSTFADIYEHEKLKKKINYIKRELNYYKSRVKASTTAKYSLDDIVTENEDMLELKRLTAKIASTRSTVLISGESGTGKELFAHAVHALSPRSQNPFIRINCAAIPDNLLESELFGYEEGSFTGAVKGGKKGLFEEAHGGTILLDEVDSLSVNLQSKLLRTIQEREIKKIGGINTINIDIRFIFTTNKSLQDMVDKGTFREDLYYRINVVNLKIPPLRERMDDLLLLVDRLIEKLNHELGMNIVGIEKEAFKLLCGWRWPGNIRELENCLERAFNYALCGSLKKDHFEYLVNQDSGRLPAEEESDNCLSLRGVRASAERDTIIRVLELVRGNKKRAASILEIDRSVLYDKIHKYRIGKIA